MFMLECQLQRARRYLFISYPAGIRAVDDAGWRLVSGMNGLLHALTACLHWPDGCYVSEWRGQLLMGGLWFVGGTVAVFKAPGLVGHGYCVVLAGIRLLVGAEVCR